MIYFFSKIISCYSVGICLCAPTLYEVDESLGEANPVMIPVSSTAIPLDDLPVFKVIFTIIIQFTIAIEDKL